MYRVYFTTNGIEEMVMETESEYLAKDWKRSGEVSVKCGFMDAVRIEYVA